MKFSALICLLTAAFFNQSSFAADSTKLSDLIKSVKASHSDGFVITQNGKLLAQTSSAEPEELIETMSMTKSFVSLAVGFLLEDHLISSIDQPVYFFYPEWNVGFKKQVTLRHLLEHTSGIAANPTTQDIYGQPDFIRYALDAQIITPPGKVFFYNNKALNLLAGIAERASGRKIDVYLKEKLFEPLGIRKFLWTTDKVGNPSGMAGLQMTASDLAKVGQFMLDQGKVRGKQLLNANWIQASFAPSSSNSSYGLLWWRSDDREYKYDESLIGIYEAAGLPSIHIAKLRIVAQMGSMPLNRFNQSIIDTFGSVDEVTRFMQFVTDHQLPHYRLIAGTDQAYAAEGYLGQFLVIIPAKQIVAVRTIKSSSVVRAGYDSCPDFIHDVLKLSASTDGSY